MGRGRTHLNKTPTFKFPSIDLCLTFRVCPRPVGVCLCAPFQARLSQYWDGWLSPPLSKNRTRNIELGTRRDTGKEIPSILSHVLCSMSSIPSLERGWMIWVISTPRLKPLRALHLEPISQFSTAYFRILTTCVTRILQKAINN